MNRLYNPKLKNNSRTLRKNMTAEERKLWYQFLKGLPVQFYRQKVMGRYIVDFCCPKAKIVIELDGGQHYESDAIDLDRERDKFLTDIGFKVLRFSNIEVNERFAGVCEIILMEIENTTKKSIF